MCECTCACCCIYDQHILKDSDAYPPQLGILIPLYLPSVDVSNGRANIAVWFGCISALLSLNMFLGTIHFHYIKCQCIVNSHLQRSLHILYPPLSRPLYSIKSRTIRAKLMHGFFLFVDTTVKVADRVSAWGCNLKNGYGQFVDSICSIVGCWLPPFLHKFGCSKNCVVQWLIWEWANCLLFRFDVCGLHKKKRRERCRYSWKSDRESCFFSDQFYKAWIRSISICLMFVVLRACGCLFVLFVIFSEEYFRQI